jgi:hypothetical protein
VYNHQKGIKDIRRGKKWPKEGKDARKPTKAKLPLCLINQVLRRENV